MIENNKEVRENEEVNECVGCLNTATVLYMGRCYTCAGSKYGVEEESPFAMYDVDYEG